MTVNVAEIHGYALTHPTLQVKVAEIHGYALVASTRPSAIRSLQGYALGVPPQTVGIRALNGYALVTINPLPKVTGKAALMTMILAAGKTVRPESHFSLGVPEVYNDPNAAYSARVPLTALPVSQLTGSMYFYYNRVPLNRIGDLGSLTIGSATTTHGLITAINTATGLALTTDDIVDTPITSGATTVTLVAASTSYMFIPDSTLTYGR